MKILAKLPDNPSFTFNFFKVRAFFKLGYVIAAKVVSAIQANFISFSLSLEILTSFFHHLCRRARKGSG
jgi:hypothetical protein